MDVERVLELVRNLWAHGAAVGAYQALGAMRQCLAAERRGDKVLAEIEQLLRVDQEKDR